VSDFQEEVEALFAPVLAEVAEGHVPLSMEAAAQKFTAGRENRRKRPRGYAPWKPHGKTQVLLDAVDAVLEEYTDYLPVTVRQIFYRLVGEFGYEKTEAACSRLGDVLVRARRARRVPFDVIRDDGPVTYSSRWHHDPEDFWDDTGQRIRDYRRDRQAGQRSYVELWCEAAGMAPQLARVADEFSVPVFSAGGFASLTAVRLIAERACRRNVPTVLLHVGDFDPSGQAIFEAIAADAAEFVLADRTIRTQRIEAVRVALTAEQVDTYELATAPPKKSDSRSARWQGETCQLEALAPDLLALLVEATIGEHFDLELLDEQIAVEHEDRTALLRALPTGER
jgi:hypothetical protein